MERPGLGVLVHRLAVALFFAAEARMLAAQIDAQREELRRLGVSLARLADRHAREQRLRADAGTWPAALLDGFLAEHARLVEESARCRCHTCPVHGHHGSSESTTSN